MISSKHLGTLLILIAAFGYATVAIFGKYIIANNLPINTVLSWRFGGAAILLWTILRLKKQKSLSPKKTLSCLLLGLFGDVLQTSLFIISVQHVGASTSALLLYTFPIYVFVIEHFWFRQRATKRQWQALALSIAGVMLVINPFQENLSSQFPGLLFGFGTGIVYAFYVSFSAYVTKGIPTISACFRLTMGAFLGFVFLAIFRGELYFPSTLPEWTLGLSMVLIATVIPLLSLIKGMQLINASQAAIIFTFEPVITILLAILLFNESLTLSKSLGCVLILIAVLWIQRKPKEKNSSPPIEGKTQIPLIENLTTD